jgi:hypothetical protein
MFKEKRPFSGVFPALPNHVVLQLLVNNNVVELKTAIYNLTIQYGPSVKFVQCGHVDMLKNFITFKE